MNLVFMTYNNYYNRIIKKESTVSAYLTAAGSNYQELTDINFNPNDGINTEQIATWTNIEWTPDYLLVYNPSEGNNVIVSRWFVIEWQRTRDGQYRAVLHRDVIADNYDAIIEAPMYIEKGYIGNVENPLLYNSESVSVNQIKQAEIPLVDESKSGWVVGYIPEDAFSTSKTISKDIAVPVNPNITVNGLSNWSYWNYCTNNPSYKFMSDSEGDRLVTFKIKDYYIVSQARGATYYLATRLITMRNDEVSMSTVNSGTIQVTSGSPTPVYPSWYTDYTSVTAYAGPFSLNNANTYLAPLKNNSTYKSYLNAILGTDVVIGDASTLRALDGQIIKDTSTNQFWKIKVISTSSTNPININNTTTAGSNLLNYINSTVDKSISLMVSVNGNYGNNELTASITSPSYALTLENVGIGVEVTIDSDRAHLNDAPYDMFCIPYSDTLKLYDGTNTITCNKAVAVGIATEIGKDTGASNIYDIQLLPYCPNRALILGSSSTDTLDLRNVKYDIITDSAMHTPVSAVIWCTDSTFAVDVAIDPDNLLFVAPYTPLTISGTTYTFQKNKYYSIPNITSEAITQYQRCAISTGSENAIKLMTCRKSDGKVLDYIYVNVIEMTNWGTYIRAYSYGHSTGAEVEMSVSNYNSWDCFFTFIIGGNSGIGGQYTGNFATICTLPTIPSLTVSNDPVERKLDNECNLYRLVSNNYNGIFEFSVAKSGGVDGFLAECTYKPWAPYIHILPKLKGLYGDNFVAIDDARGLICGGDYSLPQLSNEWSNYQLQNKTYQDMFDRQIKNMDVMNDIARTQAAVTAGLGAVQGMISGASSGAMVGGGYGAIAGAVIGGTMSATAGAVDYDLLIKQQEENRSFAIDNYNYNLQNIQAIPTSLTKTSALVYNTRIFPFVEYYTCTDIERQALRNKLTYDGMSVLAIGKLSDYLDIERHFFKGKIIRLENIAEDSHLASTIFEEINKGVYM